jgi:hypothetical protein
MVMKTLTDSNLPAKRLAAKRKQKTQGSEARRPVHSNEMKTGAGEGIRTLDPNLGKVVLYP